MGIASLWEECMNTMEEQIAKMEGILKKWVKNVDELVAKSTAGSAETRVSILNQVAELKPKLQHAKALLQEAKAASADKWKRLQSYYEYAWHQLELAFTNHKH
jgi:hypothetical protein